MLKVLAPDVAWYQDFIFNVILKLPGVIDVRSIQTLAEDPRAPPPSRCGGREQFLLITLHGSCTVGVRILDIRSMSSEGRALRN